MSTLSKTLDKQRWENVIHVDSLWIELIVGASIFHRCAGVHTPFHIQQCLEGGSEDL
jgi:hypothetical protein